MGYQQEIVGGYTFWCSLYLENWISYILISWRSMAILNGVIGKKRFWHF